MSKRKGYSQAKRAHRVASASLKDLVILYSPEFEGSIMLNPKKKVAIRPNQVTISALMNVRHNWSIFLCAFGKTAEGDIYMRGDEYPFKEKVFHHEIQDAIIEAHEELAKELGDEFHTLGFIAGIRDWNWDPDDAFKLFREIGGI